MQYFTHQHYNFQLTYCDLYSKLLIIHYTYIFEETSQTKAIQELK